MIEKQRGRPKVQQKQRLTEKASAKLTPDDYAALAAKANDAGMTNARYIRALILNDLGRAPKPKAKPSRELVRTRHELNSNGVLLNQLARTMNRHNVVGTKEDIKSLRGAVIERLRAIDAVLQRLTGTHR